MARGLYEMQEWEDLPSENTPLSAERLEHIEQGISDAMSERALKEKYDDYWLSLGRKNGTAKGWNSLAHGTDVEASGQSSFAGGEYTAAEGTASHAEGAWTISSGYCQHVQGKFNVKDTSGDYAHIVGGGTSETNRRNIYTLDWQGNAIFAGNVQGTVDGKLISLAGLQAEMEGRYDGLQPFLQGMSNGLSQLGAKVSELETRVAELEANQNAAEGGETT